MEWGSEANAHYQGSLEVSESGGSSSVTVRISTDRQEEADVIDRALDETMAKIKAQLGTP
jgi:beta-lactam-binding protein with PASTA domain